MKAYEKSTPILPFFLALFIFVVIRSAWLGDDAFITFRTVDNFIHGYGLRWNVAERVQAYTHPLWMMVLSFVIFFTREFYYSVLALSVVCSALAVYVLCFRIAVSEWNTVLVFVILILSQSFIDFSTSGLENPLTHLLLALFFYQFFQRIENRETISPRQIYFLSLTASLAVLNRMDIALLVFPPLIYGLFLKKPDVKMMAACVLGQCPFILWELFSLFYYGFPFPNTAYAKLNTGIHSSLILSQGFYYVLNSLSRDPVTLTLIAATFVFSLIHIREYRHYTVIGLCTGLYILYVIKIGGDFMSGRFFAAPFFCSLAILARLPLNRPKEYVLAAFAFVLLFAMPPLAGDLAEPPLEEWIDHRGIADERGFWSSATGLLAKERKRFLPDSIEAADGVDHRSRGLEFTGRTIIGMYGFYVGPDAHIIDRCALVEPVLSRLPVGGTGNDWRIGHFKREALLSYQRALAGKGNIMDPSLRIYWHQLCILTRGDLFSLERFAEIWKFNTGQYDYLLDEYCERHYRIVPYNDVNVPEKAEGTWWDAPGNTILNEHGLGIEITLDEIPAEKTYSIGLNRGESYRIIYYKDKKRITSQTITIPDSPYGGLTNYHGKIPDAAIQNRFDTIRVKPVSSSGKPSLGHFHLDESKGRT